MALRNIVKEGDEVLTKKCRPVEKFDDRLASLLDDMYETMTAGNGVGLAAPQVGMLRRAFVIDIGEGKLEFVNPEIIKTSGRQETGEGCLSCPGEYGITVHQDLLLSRLRTETARNLLWKPLICLQRQFATKMTTSMEYFSRLM